jgi:hypothetical protein
MNHDSSQLCVGPPIGTPRTNGAGRIERRVGDKRHEGPRRSGSAGGDGSVKQQRSRVNNLVPRREGGRRRACGRQVLFGWSWRSLARLASNPSTSSLQACSCCPGFHPFASHPLRTCCVARITDRGTERQDGAVPDGWHKSVLPWLGRVLCLTCSRSACFDDVAGHEIQFRNE